MGVTYVTSEVSLITYLNSDRKVYRFRRIVPPELQSYFHTKSGKPRTEFMFSLGTKDKRKAEELCRVEAVKTDELFNEARIKLAAAKLVPARTAADVARDKAREEKARIRDEYEQAAREFQEEEEWRAKNEMADRETTRNAIIERLSGPTEGLSKQLLAMRDLIDEREFDPPEVKEARARALAKSWAEGEKELVWPIGANDVPEKQVSYLGLMSLFEGYVAERQPKPATIKAWKPVMVHLIDYLGHDDASRVTAVEIIEWKNLLLNEKNSGGEVRQARTIRDTYVAAAKVIFGWGSENYPELINPVSKVKVRVPKRTILRNDLGFTPDEAITILRGTLKSVPPTLTPQTTLAFRWVPWLCAYTGARVNEMTQLRAEDIVWIDQCWVVRITPDAGSVKSGKARTVPLHSHLIEQGFIEVVKARKEGPLFYEPSRSLGGSSGNPQYKKVGERLAAWVRKLGIIDVGVAPNHGWRHMFRTSARSHGVPESAADAIQGHVQKSVGRQYGTFDTNTLALEIEKLPRFVT